VPRLCDRSLATAILFDQCPNGNTAAALKALVECPPEMGLSYPCNACWRYWALGKLGRADVVIRDFRQRWATMKSVLWNNTLQEDWDDAPDSPDEWSHCPVSPIYVLFSEIAGIRPTAPGFARCQIRPQLADLPDLRLTYHTPRGPIRFAAERHGHGHHVAITIPAGCQAELLLPNPEGVNLPPLVPDSPLGLKRFQLESGRENVFQLRVVSQQTSEQLSR
jgi:alpha-L-rhamnosidase